MDFVTYILFATGAPLTATLLPLLLCRKGFTPRLVGVMLGISAGVLLSIATLDLIPEAIKMGLESTHLNSLQTKVGSSDAHEHQHSHSKSHHDHGDEEIEGTLKVIMSGVGIGFFVLLFVEQVATSMGGGHTHSHSHSHAQKFDKSDPEQPERKRSTAMSSIALLGLGLHSFFDGLVIAGAFEASDQVGSRVAVAIILHKFPDGLVLSSLIASAVTLESINSSTTLSTVASTSQSDSANNVNNNNNNPNSPRPIGLSTIPRHSLYSVFAVCLATPLGAFFGRATLSGTPQLTLAFFLAFSAGSFLFITTLGILPELFPSHQAHQRQNAGISRFGAMFSIVAGYLGFFLTSTFFGHPH